MTENEFKYWAFLSYSEADNAEKRPTAPEAGCLRWGDWLLEALEAFPIPADFCGHPNARGERVPERIDPVFQDQEEQPENASLSADIRRALEQSRCLIVVCSPHSAGSRHVNEVARYFKQLGRGNRILSFVIAGEPHAGVGAKPGAAPASECFAPALRHPLLTDGTPDTSRRDQGHIFVDARHGVDKREILATDHRRVETELEIAKIQLIAGLLGVGFNGLWQREQKRRFAGFAAAQQQAREALSQLETARRQIREAQTQALEIQNLPPDVHRQIEAAQTQARETQDQLRAAQGQLEAWQRKVQDMQSQLEAARSRTLATESKFLEAQQQARATQNQLEMARQQTREAQGKASENQSASQAISSRIQAAENNVLDAQNKLLAAQNQIQEFEDQARAARNQVLEIQAQTRDGRSQVEEAQTEARSARRLSRILALMAVLALVAAGLVASMAWRQHWIARQAQAQVAAAEMGKFDLPQGKLDEAQIRQALQVIGGAEQKTNRWRSLDHLAAWISPEEIPAALKTSSLIVDDRQRTHFQKWLLLRLGWLNPESALTSAGAVTGKIVNERGANDSVLYLQLAVLDNWMQTDLPGAFNWAGQLPEAEARQRALEKIIAARPADDFTNTLARLNDLNPVPGEPVYKLLFQRWAAQDPVQAIEQRQQIPGHDTDNQILRAIMTSWVTRQPDAAVAWAQALPEAFWRNQLIADLFSDWAEKDLEAAATACQQLPAGSAKDKAWKNILSRWIAKDPAAAAAPVKDLAPGDYRQKAITELCRRWAESDVPAALAWARSLSSAAEQRTATGQIVVDWANQDPPAAAHFASQHSELSGKVLGAIATAWSHSDWNATTNWVENLPNGAEKNTALSMLSAAWAQNDPQGMATYALALPAGDDQDAMIQGLLSRWAPADPASALDWLGSFPETNAQPARVQSVVKTWAQHEPAAAAKWLANQPAGTASDDVTNAFLEGAGEKYPAFAAQWTQSIGDETRRQKLQVQVARQWLKTDPTAAAKWIDSLDLPDAVKASLQKSPP